MDRCRLVKQFAFAPPVHSALPEGLPKAADRIGNGLTAFSFLIRDIHRRRIHGRTDRRGRRVRGE
jgi:hypothetical protein